MKALALGPEARRSIQTLRQRGYRVHYLATPSRVLDVRSGPGVPVCSPGTGDLPWADASFDLVVAAGWFERVRWLPWSLQECSRVLRQNGCALLRPRVAERSRLDGTFGGRLVRRVLRKAGLVKRGLQSVRSKGELAGVIEASEALEPVTLPGHWRDLATAMNLDAYTPVTADHRLAALRDPEDAERRFRAEFADELASGAVDFQAGSDDVGLLRLSDKDRVLALSPHPDDEVIGCGGALLQLSDLGATVTVLQMSPGATSVGIAPRAGANRYRVRVVEAEAVARRLQAHLLNWAVGDELRDDARNAANLAAVMRDVDPTLVFVPSLSDAHPEHQAATRLLARVLDGGPHTPRILSYEVWSLMQPNRYLNISRSLAGKLDLMSLYRTALRPVDYLKRIRLLAWHRGRQFVGGGGFAEAYVEHDTRAYLAAARGSSDG